MIEQRLAATATADMPRIKLKEKLGFMTFSGSYNILYIFKNSYFQFFLTNVVKIPIAWAGAIIAIGIIWDAINDPLIGYWSVNHKFKSGEVVRPIALWHPIPWAIIMILMFSDFGLNDVVATGVGLVLYVLFDVFNTTLVLPYNVMSSLATSLDSERRSLSVFRNLGGCIASAVSGIAFYPLLRLLGGMDANDNLIDAAAPRAFLLGTAIIGVIVVLGCFFHYFTTRERVKQISQDTERIKVGQLLKMLVSCRSWRCNIIYVVCYLVINSQRMSSMNYYTTYVMESTGAAQYFNMVFLIASLLTTFFVSYVDKRLGRRKAMMLGPAIAILGKIWFIANPFSPVALYVNTAAMGISVSFAFVVFNVNRARIVDIVEAKHGRRVDSMISTTDNFASKLGTSLSTLLTTTLLASAGFNEALGIQQPAGAISIINFTLGWAPLLGAAIMFIAAALLPIEKEYEEAKERLAAAVK
jgi:Na+/melibiose symporter-like transporter